MRFMQIQLNNIYYIIMHNSCSKETLMSYEQIERNILTLLDEECSYNCTSVTIASTFSTEEGRSLPIPIPVPTHIEVIPNSLFFKVVRRVAICRAPVHPKRQSAL